VNDLEAIFPRLVPPHYRITSPSTKRYNCVAWAAGDEGNWWWPGDGTNESYWPPNSPPGETLSAFISAFATLGFETCAAGVLESEFEKIAIFTDENGLPTHVARQLENATWTSKIGELEDIEHRLSDLEGLAYGKVAQIMRRRRGT
jgi:hypothetical protein